MAKITSYTDFFNQFQKALEYYLNEQGLYLIHIECDEDDDTSSHYYVLNKGDYYFEGATAETRGDLVINEDCVYAILDLYDGNEDSDDEGRFFISNNIGASDIEYHMDFDDIGIRNLGYLQYGESLSKDGEKAIATLINLIKAFMI